MQLEFSQVELKFLKERLLVLPYKILYRKEEQVR